jgi:Ca2+-binding EF-hand superfamily protein
LQKKEVSFRGAINHMKSSSKMKFGKMDKTFLPGIAAQAVTPLLNQIKSLAQSYEKLKQGDVKDAFDKFDKDGNGTIDLKELAELSRELGQMLTTNQAK